MKRERCCRDYTRLSLLLILCLLLVAVSMVKPLYAESTEATVYSGMPFGTCEPGPIGSGLDVHVFVEGSDYAHRADENGRHRKYILQMLVDSLLIDAFIREVDNSITIHKYDYQEKPTQLASITISTGITATMPGFHTTIDRLNFGTTNVGDEHIAKLFAGIADKLGNIDRNKHAAILVLNDMRPNGVSDEFAANARNTWLEAIESRPQGSSSIYVIDFVNEYPNDNTLPATRRVIEGWKRDFFASTETDTDKILGGYRTMHLEEVLREVAKVVQEIAARTTVSSTVSAPTFLELHGAMPPIPVCPFSQVRFGVVHEEPASILPDGIEGVVRSSFGALGTVDTVGGHFSPPLNGGPNVSQDRDMMFLYRAVGGVAQMTCPPENMFVGDTVLLRIPQSDGKQTLTYDWNEADDDIETIGSDDIVLLTAGIPLTAGVSVSQTLWIGTSTEEDRIYCPPTTIRQPPALTVRPSQPIETLESGDTITWTVTLNPTYGIEGPPTVQMVQLLEPDKTFIEDLVSTDEPDEDGEITRWTFSSQMPTPCTQWVIYAQLAGQTEFDVLVSLDDPYAFYWCPDDPEPVQLYVTLNVTGAITSTIPLSDTLPLTWSVDGVQQTLSITSNVSYLPYEAELSQVERDEPLAGQAPWWVVITLLIILGILLLVVLVLT